MYDVIIIGGGVVGTAVAWALSRYNLRLALLEAGPDVAVGATKANSAIVHGGYAESHKTLKGQLCFAGRRQFAELEKQLRFGFRQTGSLVLAFGDEDLPRLDAMHQNGRANGLHDIRILNRDEILALEPGVNPDVRWALYCEGAGVCSPFGMAVAFAEVAVQNGLDLHLNTEVTGIALDGNGVLQVRADGGFVCGAARYVVNAAGASAAHIARMVADDSFALHYRSGEYVVLQQGEGEELVRQVLFDMPSAMGKGILTAPTVFGNVIAGPDAIDEVRYDRDTHPDRLLQVFNGAQHSVPGLDIHRFVRSYAGVRAVSDTDDFIIRASGTFPRMIHAAGIQSPGITAAPAIADRVVELLQQEGLDLPPRRDYDGTRHEHYYKPPRLENAVLQEKLALPQGAKGRMLCRCEQVPESLVRAAVAQGIPITTPDAVKRRTTAGMGWCQGAFCRPRVVKLLEELNGGPGGVDARTDNERDEVTRVTREEMIAYTDCPNSRDK